jgi:gamma-glutamyl phosphate reductase
MSKQTNARLSRRSSEKADGPTSLDELTSYKWLGIGNGQIRA